MKWKRGEKTQVAKAAGIPLPNFLRLLRGTTTDDAKNIGLSPAMAKKLEAATREVLGEERTIPAESWIFRKKFPHPLITPREEIT